MPFTIAPDDAPSGGFTIAPDTSTSAPKRGLFEYMQSQGLVAPHYAPFDPGIIAGAVKGASDIGSTLLTPFDAAARALGVQNSFIGRTDRRQAVDEAMRGLGADTGSTTYAAGRLGADIAGTAGVGGLLAKGATAAGNLLPVVAQYAPKLSAALESGGFSLGTRAPGPTTAADLATRVGAGAVVGGASAGAINPDDAGTGALIGGALPAAAKVAGTIGTALAPKASPEVVALYQKAKNLGIDIPADRIVNSRPLNAVAASLNYVPLAGRAETEARMLSQANTAVSRTFGQNSDNVVGALGKAEADLGAKFEHVLSTNSVNVDNQFVNELVDHLQRADRELGRDGVRIIGAQIDEIMGKAGANGEIDGQAAYNIKLALDRIGKRNTPEAYYARDLKRSLMNALDRTLGPAQTAEFSTLRKQYGNMLELQNIVPNGAEGGVSVARLAGLKNLNNPDLQDLADIAAQFLKARETPHGAAQRVFATGAGLGIGAGFPAAVPAFVGGVTAARTANAALNSETLKALLLNPAASVGRARSIASNPALRALLYPGPSSGNP
jgi:hypothetical protein